MMLVPSALREGVHPGVPLGWGARLLCIACWVIATQPAVAGSAEAREALVDGTAAGEVLVGGRRTICIRCADGDMTAYDRAKIVAERVNGLLKEGVIPEQITFREVRGETALAFEDVVIATVDRPTADLEGVPVETLAERWRGALVAALLELEKPAPPEGGEAGGPVFAGLLPPVARYVTSAGVTLLLSERPGEDEVAVCVAMGSGSLQDGDRAGYGLADAVSSALPLGTRRRSREQIRADLDRLGGSFALDAELDCVRLQLVTARQNLANSLDLLADLVKNATFPPALLQIALTPATPLVANDAGRWRSLVESQLLATMYRRHPVRYPVAGRPELRALLTRAELLEYYGTHYVPENTVCAVVGDFDQRTALALMEQAFALWPYRPKPQGVLPTEPPQTGPRSARAAVPVSVEGGALGWRTVPAWDPEAPALAVIAALLTGTGGETGRLGECFAREGEVVDTVEARSVTPGFEAGYLAVFWSAEAARHPAVEALVRGEVRRLREEPVGDAEVRVAVDSVRTAYLSRYEEVAGTAQALVADELAVGDAEFGRAFLARLSQVTSTSIQVAAQRYLSPPNSTVETLIQGVATSVERSSTAAG